MTVREYILTKLTAFNIPQSMMMDVMMSSGLDCCGEYDASVAVEVGKAMCGMIVELILMPRMSNINENGFSVSWDYTNLGKYYLWLCRRYGIIPDKDVVAALGLNTIIDRTSSW